MEAFFPVGFVILMALMGIAFVVVFALVVAGFVRAGRGMRKLEREGIDPVTVLPEAAHNLGQMAAHADRSVEQRLRELDRLRSEGLISADEYDAQRAEIIKDV